MAVGLILVAVGQQNDARRGWGGVTAAENGAFGRFPRRIRRRAWVILVGDPGATKNSRLVAAR